MKIESKKIIEANKQIRTIVQVITDDLTVYKDYDEKYYLGERNGSVYILCETDYKHSLRYNKVGIIDMYSVIPYDKQVKDLIKEYNEKFN